MTAGKDRSRIGRMDRRGGARARPDEVHRPGDWAPGLVDAGSGDRAGVGQPGGRRYNQPRLANAAATYGVRRVEVPPDPGSYTGWGAGQDRTQAVARWPVAARLPGRGPRPTQVPPARGRREAAVPQVLWQMVVGEGLNTRDAHRFQPSTGAHADGCRSDQRCLIGVGRLVVEGRFRPAAWDGAV